MWICGFQDGAGLHPISWKYGQMCWDWPKHAWGDLPRILLILLWRAALGLCIRKWPFVPPQTPHRTPETSDWPISCLPATQSLSFILGSPGRDPTQPPSLRSLQHPCRTCLEDQAYHLQQGGCKADRSSPRALLKSSAQPVMPDKPFPSFYLQCSITRIKKRERKKLSLAALWQFKLLLHIQTPVVPDQGVETLCFVFSVLWAKEWVWLVLK